MAVSDSHFPCGLHRQRGCCPAHEVMAADAGLDHVDALGCSGMAFRIQVLPRELLCSSTVDPRFGFVPELITARPTDLRKTLQQALQLMRGGTADAYRIGQPAWRIWTALLSDDEASPAFRAQVAAHAEDQGIAAMNGYCFNSLLHVREAAGPFLRRCAEHDSMLNSTALLAAAEACDQLVNRLRKLGEPKWTPAGRNRQAAVMMQAAELEQGAVQHIAAAIS